MNPINVMMTAGEMTKIGNLVKNFHKPAEGANPCARFGYGKMKCPNKPWGNSHDQ